MTSMEIYEIFYNDCVLYYRELENVSGTSVLHTYGVCQMANQTKNTNANTTLVLYQLRSVYIYIRTRKKTL